jgi:acyl-CoA thioesterase-1
VGLQQNLAAMVKASQQKGAQVLILGMQLPPNYGQRYTTAFAAVFPHVASEFSVPLVPFVLEGVGGVPEMMQADGIHPTAEAQPRLLENVWPTLKPLL